MTLSFIYYTTNCARLVCHGCCIKNGRDTVHQCQHARRLISSHLSGQLYTRLTDCTNRWATHTTRRPHTHDGCHAAHPTTPRQSLACLRSHIRIRCHIPFHPSIPPLFDATLAAGTTVCVSLCLSCAVPCRRPHRMLPLPTSNRHPCFRMAMQHGETEAHVSDDTTHDVFQADLTHN